LVQIEPFIVVDRLSIDGVAILGGIAIGLLETFTGEYISRSMQDLMPYMALLLILILKPSGFSRRKKLEKV